MDRDNLWKRLSGSINYYIRNVWRDDFLVNDEDLLEDYMQPLLGEVEGEYEYLDKQTFEYIKLSEEEVDRIKAAFLERINRKKVKYKDEIEELIKQKAIEEEERKNRDFKVIDLNSRR